MDPMIVTPVLGTMAVAQFIPKNDGSTVNSGTILAGGLILLIFLTAIGGKAPKVSHLLAVLILFTALAQRSQKLSVINNLFK